MNALEKLTALIGPDCEVWLYFFYGEWNCDYKFKCGGTEIAVKSRGPDRDLVVAQTFERVMKVAKGIPEIAGPMLTHQPDNNARDFDPPSIPDDLNDEIPF